MISAQTTLTDLKLEYCKSCMNLTQIEKRNFCTYFQAFLADETLSEPCDFHKHPEEKRKR